MLILGIDTATRVGTVGVVRAPLLRDALPAPHERDVAARSDVLADVVRVGGLEHGAALMPLVDEALERAGVGLEQIDAVAVSVGPGSFTGLRVALATAKGFVLGTDVRLIGVPTLEAFAATLLPGWVASESVPADAVVPGTLVASCLDARKGEVYGAAFALREGEHGLSLERLTPDRAARPAAFREMLESLLAESGGRAVLLGDGAERHRGEIVDPLEGRVVALPFARHHPHGAVVARLGAALLAARGPDDVAELVPFYARASEAEIARERGAARGPSR
ncbi:MAG TPA: tRNA (adenosine(37)-N6)-threonylcarbamoyltransferase complex dimerization subunit type 1 TsaB [Candidatus Binatia bacterium]